MRRRSKIGIVSAVLAALLLVPVLVLVAAPMVYAPLVGWLVRSTTGAEVDYTDMGVSLFPLHVSATELTLRNPKFRQPLLTAQRLGATVIVADWLGGMATWWSATGEALDLRLEQDAQGNSNWQLRPTEPAQSSSGPGALLDFSEVWIEGLTVTRVAEEPHRVLIDQFAVAQRADESLRIDVAGRYRGEPLLAQGTLALPTSEGAKTVDFHAEGLGGSVNVSGQVGHDGISPGRADVSFELTETAALGALLDLNLEPLTPLSLAGTLRTPQSGSWQADLDGSLDGDEAGVAGKLVVTAPRYEIRDFRGRLGLTHIEGEATVDTAEQRIQGRLQAPRLDLQRLAQFSRVAGGEEDVATPSSPWKAPKVLRTWRYDLVANVDELRYGERQVTGLNLALSQQQGNLVLTGGLDGLDTRAGASDGVRIVRPLSIRSELVFADAGGPATEWALTLSAEGLEAHGEVDLAGMHNDSPRLLVRGTLDSLAALEGLPAPTFDGLLPLELDAMAFQRADVWHIELSRLAAAGAGLEGRLDVDLQAQPLTISGALASRRLDLNSIPTTARFTGDDAADENASEAEAQAEDQPNRADTDVIPDDPLDWSWLDAVAVDVALRVDRLTFNRTHFHNLRTRVLLEPGKRLRIDPFDADLAKGGIRGHVEVRARESGPQVQTYLAISQLVPADLGQPDDGLIDGGATDLLVDLRAQGRSLQDLASSLDGQMALEVQQATIRNNLFEQLTSDLLVQTLRLINPFIDQDPETELECAAGHVVAENGVLTSPNRLVLETSKVVVRAGGTVDLADETLTVDFIPSPREGLGISVSGLAELVRIGGTLAQPDTQADASAVLKGGATVGAAIATGGLSLLAQGLFARARNQGTRCGSIFEQETQLPEPIRVQAD